MKVLVVAGGEVVVLSEYLAGPREVVRQALKEQFDSEWVWWEDEVGTVLDPISGPHPKFGPKAEQLSLEKGQVMRVKVWNGTQSEYLGEGDYVGDVPVVAVEVQGTGGKWLLSLEEPKNLPDPLPKGGVIRELPDNPKIILDSGQTVYGCQVWWEPAEECSEERS